MSDQYQLPDNPQGWHFQDQLEISVVDTHAQHQDQSNDQFVLNDIREPHELEISSIENALHIPMGDIPASINELDVDEDTTIAIICRSGRRSLDVALYLQQQGLEGARSVAGGINWWADRLDSSIEKY